MLSEMCSSLSQSARRNNNNNEKKNQQKRNSRFSSAQFRSRTCSSKFARRRGTCYCLFTVGCCVRFFFDDFSRNFFFFLLFKSFFFFFFRSLFFLFFQKSRTKQLHTLFSLIFHLFRRKRKFWLGIPNRYYRDANSPFTDEDEENPLSGSGNGPVEV